MSKNSNTLFVRIDRPTLKAIDRRLAHERRARPGTFISRSDLVRSLLNAGLSETVVGDGIGLRMLDAEREASR